MNKSKLVLKCLSKQGDIDMVFKVIQSNVLKGAPLPGAVKEIQAGYQISPYFKDIYLYLAQSKLPNATAAIQKMESLAERYIIVQNGNNPLERNIITGYSRNVYR